ncbi:MAG: nuclease [Stutzerimonas stutzeri]|nr:MAG: nuclease [Stutzerimonas stutzeri]
MRISLLSATALATVGVMIALGLGGLTTSASEEAIVGQATVIDGDTIEVQRVRIRLAAIDAPESDQLCNDAAGKLYRCGQTASFALADLIGRSHISCRTELDRSGAPQTSYNRTIATCALNGVDLGAWMVEHGWAVPYWRYGGARYRTAYELSRAKRSGVWAGEFEEPSQFRARKRSAN